MFKNKQAVGGTIIAGLLAVFTLFGPTNGISPFINIASAGYGGSSSSSGIQRVTICHNGETKRVPRSEVPSYLDKGATKMRCTTEQQVLGVTTTSEQEQIQNLQRQIILLLQQLLTSLKAQN